MAPQVYEEARAEAPIHLQLVQFGAAPLASRATSLRVTGRVVRVFRDRERQLHWGQRISFWVSVTSREPSGPPMPSGELYHNGEAMRRARWLEAFLESWNGELQLVRSQVIVIRHPTFEPVCGPDAKGFLCGGTAR